MLFIRYMFPKGCQFNAFFRSLNIIEIVNIIILLSVYTNELSWNCLPSIPVSGHCKKVALDFEVAVSICEYSF